MSARKKGSKSSAKKQEESHSKTKNAALLSYLAQRVQLDKPGSDRNMLASSILEALLAKESDTLDHLLSEWSQDQQAIDHVVQHILQSKLPLFIDKAIAILKEDRSKQHIYPWLARVLHNHPGKDLQAHFQGLQLSDTEEGELQGLMRMQGKLRLILQQ